MTPWFLTDPPDVAARKREASDRLRAEQRQLSAMLCMQRHVRGTAARRRLRGVQKAPPSLPSEGASDVCE
eukprot:2389510-Pleurochrysis_carterae.AAC.1